MTNAIEVRALRKTFGRATALDGLDLAVRSGEVHAFLGPNGAGKTTTIRILLGLLRKDGGEASLLGGDPWRDATTLHTRLAYVPGDVTLWPGLTGGEIIDLLGSLRGSRSGLDPKRRQDLIERFALDPAKKARAYSKGNRQKVALIAALASDAELAGPVTLDGLPGVHAAEVRGTHLHCEVDPAALNDVLTRLTAAGVVALTCRPPTLEELFLRHYSAERAGPGATP